MARVLLYNIQDEARRRKVKALLFRLGLPSREVQPGEQGVPLSRLLNLPGAENGERAAGEEAPEPFTEEMLVMHGLAPRQFHGLVDGLRQQGVVIPLKAVVTPHNVRWTSAELHRELSAERAALAAGGKSAHA